MKCVNKIAAFLALVGLAITLPAGAEMTQAEVDRLGKDLTPNGAEKAGSKDGTIPAWEGGLTSPPAGWTPQKGYVDPFPNDKPLFTINAANAEKYKDKLTAGQMALLKKYPNFAMNVYQSRRTFAYPEEVYKATKEQALKTTTDNISVQNYTGIGTPFPVPKSGAEAISNHQLRWFGANDRCSDWAPVQPSGDWYRVGMCENFVQPSNLDNPRQNLLFAFYGAYDAPSTLVGTIILVHDPVDRAKGAGRDAWVYNAGQRRVRRAPDMAFESPQDGQEGMETSDGYWCFNGSLERYDWKLVGKVEKYIPYNSYKAMDPTLKYADMLQKGTMKSDIFRYELHRVWHVQATLKPGMSHSYAKRDFYLDEDSHMIAWSDAYDGQGTLWRPISCPLVQAYDAKTMFHALAVTHDLVKGSYIMVSATNERKQPANTWGTRAKWSDFQVDAIRRRGTR